MRKIIVHYHIFKNAGTSVDHLLKNAFGSAWSAFEGQSPTDVLRSADLEDFLFANAEIRAVSTHLGRPPAPNGFEVYPIVFIRHPLDRVESVYLFTRSDSSQPNFEKARSYSLREYVEWALQSSDGGIVIRDYQTVHLSEASFREKDIYLTKALPVDYSQAERFLRSLPVVGVVDRFEESIGKYSELISRGMGPIQFEPLRVNSSSGRADELDDRLASLHDKLGKELFDRLVKANTFDLELYRLANVLLDQA